VFAYVDCGVFNGKIMRRVLSSNRYGPKYHAYAFECNPSLAHIRYGDGVTLYHRAVWVDDSTLKFYINTKHPRIQGNSLFKDKRTGSLDKDHPVEVKGIDFSKWLSDTFTADDYVVVKMNIEGSEYPVLEKCVNDGTIDLINELHIQWHYNKIPNMTERHKRLVANLKSVKNLKMYHGYGVLRS